MYDMFLYTSVRIQSIFSYKSVSKFDVAYMAELEKD